MINKFNDVTFCQSFVVIVFSSVFDWQTVYPMFLLLYEILKSRHAFFISKPSVTVLPLKEITGMLKY